MLLNKRLRWIWPCLLLAAFMIFLVLWVSDAAQTDSCETLGARVCAVIDAGHGGEDGGAVAGNGICESKLNLQISLRVNDLLRLMGYQTAMVRTTDDAVSTEGDTIAKRKAADLKARAELINGCENAVLLSIHQNYFFESQYAGGQVFYADTEKSKYFAEILQGNFQKFLQSDNRRQAKLIKDIYLMEHISCPGVLIECGFLSNPQEAQLLSSSQYQKKLAIVICISFSEFLDQTQIY